MSFIEIPVIYEDKNFLAVNKPSGLMVHGTRVSGEYSLADWIHEQYPETGTVGDNPKVRPGMVHRLDKETSGVMLVARTQEYFDYLKSLFQKREMKKTYCAAVWGEVKPKMGIIEKPIGIHGGSLKRSVHASRMQKDAITEYRVEQIFEKNREPFSLLSVFPKTGRTHQIRVHLASIGHPVIGDKLYGRKREPEWVRRLMLHAVSIEFTNKEGTRMRVEAELPKEFADLYSL